MSAWDRWHRLPHRLQVAIEVTLTAVTMVAFGVFLTWAWSGFGRTSEGSDVTLTFASRYGTVNATAAPVGGGAFDPIDPPRQPLKVGWWGVPPGSAQGTTLLTWRASELRYPTGAEDNLGLVDVGSTIIVNGLPYKVDTVSTLDVDILALSSTDLLSANGPSQVVIVAYEGWTYQGKGYTDGLYTKAVVVVATPQFTPTPPPIPTVTEGG
jgi:hypothetical protein